MAMTDQEREYLYDESLVLRIQLGESTAFDELVARWQDRLWLRPSMNKDGLLTTNSQHNIGSLFTSCHSSIQQLPR